MLVPKSFTGERQTPSVERPHRAFSSRRRENREQGGFLECQEDPQWNDRIGLDQVATGKIVSKEASSNAKMSFELGLGGVSPAIWRYRGV